ncbi:hypothetical protein [Sphingobacterium corticibacter]|uniref:Fimbrillin family protein n=1 Tax=Sphingobacterium corticibacter TaxID=2171749 RepID=A0A2T8HKC0_9SPHI|nr:hypothetical protein [Sphingobacterium corticibacter]PVH25845.1 hypothetical protein DC487_07900 [Sphingobacterium corticibacter]
MMIAQTYFGFSRRMGACFILLSYFITSCERNAGREDLQDPNASLMVVEAMVDDTENVDLTSPINAMGSIGNSSQSSNRHDVNELANKSTFVEGDDFDAITSISNNWKKSVGEGSNELASGGGISRAATPMTPGFKYRLVLYKLVGSTQTYWRQKQLTSSTSTVTDTTQQIEVVRGDTYRWYAYSYNNATDIPVLANPGANPQINMGNNSDFLYANGTISIPATGAANTPLNINFLHQVGRLAVEIDARGMFADNITQLDVTLGGLPGASAPLTNGTFGLVSGQVTSTAPYTPSATLAVGNFQNVDAGFNDRKAIYFHSATPATLSNNLAVTLNNVTITMTDGTTTRAFTGLNRVFNLTVPSSLAAGRTHNAKIDLVESPLIVNNGLGTTPVRWARTNLYLHPSARNRYRFHATYAHTDMRSSYWPFRANTPTMFGVDGDPCTLVHPTSRPGDGLSVWRQATVADFNTLGVSPGVFGPTGPSQNVVYNPNGGLGYYEYPATGTGAPQYVSSNLRFNMNGFANAVNVVSGLISIEIGNRVGYGTEARIWTHDQFVAIPPIVSLGAYGFRAARVPASGLTAAYNSINPSLLEVLNLSLLGGGLLDSSFQNVRCVRR